MKLSPVLLLLPLSLLLSQCAANDERLLRLLVSPTGEQYEFYPCAQLIGTMKSIKANEKNLKTHIANAGAVGSTVGGYKLDYANQHGAFVAARNAAKDKNCEIPADVLMDEPL